MVDSLIVACCNAQAEQVDGNDLALAQGQEALNDLRDLGWDEEVGGSTRSRRHVCPQPRSQPRLRIDVCWSMLWRYARRRLFPHDVGKRLGTFQVCIFSGGSSRPLLEVPAVLVSDASEGWRERLARDNATGRQCTLAFVGKMDG